MLNKKQEQNDKQETKTKDRKRGVERYNESRT